MSSSRDQATLVPPDHCLDCGHHEDAHSDGLADDENRLCVGCPCPGLRLCAACCGDPEAHDLHVCGRPS